MKPTKPSMQADQHSADQVRSVLNFFAELADDPLEELKRKRARIAAQLSALLATMNLSHSKVAEKAHIKRSQLSRQLSGDANLTIDSISRICEAAGADFDIVFRVKAASALKQFWEGGCETQLKIVSPDASGRDELRAVIEKHHLQSAVSSNRWNGLTAAHRSRIAYRLEVNDVNGQAGCITSTTISAANEKQKYEPTQPIAA